MRGLVRLCTEGGLRDVTVRVSFGCSYDSLRDVFLVLPEEQTKLTQPPWLCCQLRPL